MKHNSMFVAMGLVSALTALPALAQTTAPAAPRSTAPSVAVVPGPTTPTASTTGWLTQGSGGEWRASKLKGVNAYNGSNEKIGEIEDLLVDSSGRVGAVVLSVGGFLGMGEHRVAVPFSQLQFDHGRGTARTGAANPGGTAPAGGGLGSATPSAAPMGAGPAVTAAADTFPDRVVLNMTRDQLKAAPAFRYAR